MQTDFEERIAKPAVRKVAATRLFEESSNLSPEGYMTVHVHFEYNGLQPCSRILRTKMVDREFNVTAETAQSNMAELRRKNPGLNLSGRFIKEL